MKHVISEILAGVMFLLSSVALVAFSCAVSDYSWR